MRLSKQQTAENRRRILETATRMFRRRGIDGVGIAELMRAAGFTHGGFYNHFRSKEALVTEACRVSLARAEAAFAEALKSETSDSWTQFVGTHIASASSPEPSDDATLAALAVDASRQGVELQRVFARAVENLTRTLSEFITRTRAFAVDGGSVAIRALALHQLSTVVGAWVLARAVSRANPELAREILRANRRWLAPSEVRASPTRPRRRLARR